jgi:hypothetical protein
MNSFNSFKNGSSIVNPRTLFKIIPPIPTYPQQLYICGGYSVGNAPYKQLVFYNDKNKAAFASLDNCGNQDIFMSMYDPTGNAIVSRIGGTFEDGVTSTVFDSSNNLYKCGYYRSAGLNIFNVDNSNFTSLNNNSSNNQYQIYLTKYDSTMNPLWSTRIVGTVNVHPIKIITDKKNNVILIGYYFANPVIIYDACGNSVSFTNDTTNSGTNSFVVKYNTNGALLWARKIGGTTSSSPTITAIDSLNNIYVAISTGALKIYNSDNSTTFRDFSLPANSPGCTIIIKYNESGTPILATQIAGDNSIISNILVDNSNNVFYIGFFLNTYTSVLNIYDSNNGTNSLGTSDVIGINNRTDIYILKYDNNSTFKWLTFLTGNRDDSAPNSLLDNYGNLYISGGFRSTSLRLYNSNKSLFRDLSNNTSLDNQITNIFVAKYNTDGSGQWAAAITGRLGQGIKDMLLGSDNNIYILGNYTSKPVTVYNTNDSSYVSFNNNGTSTYDVLIVKYSSSGTISWATHFGSSGTDEGFSMSLDSGNNVYICTYYINTLSIYDKNNNTTTTKFLTFTTGSTNNNIGIIKYDQNGNYKWASYIGGLGNKQIGYMKIDKDNNIYISGFYNGTNPVTMYSSNNTAFMDISSNTITGDIFVAKYDSNGNGIYGRRIGNTNQYFGPLYMLLSNPIEIPK